jgi:uncharacterized protein
MAYIGTKAGITPFVPNNFNSANFVGDGTSTGYVLPEVVVSNESILIHIDGIKQHSSAYTTLNTALTFSEAPPNTSKIEVIIFGIGSRFIGKPTSNTVGVSELQTSDGTVGQVLTTDGAGNLSFSSAGLGDLDGGDSATVYSVADITIDSGGAT